MVALHAKRSTLSRLQVAVPADIACGDDISRSAEIDIPAARYLRRFRKKQFNLPTVDRNTAGIYHRYIQLITAAPDIGVAHFAGDKISSGGRTGS